MFSTYLLPSTLLFLLISPLLPLANPVPDLPTRANVAPRQISGGMGRRMQKKAEPLQKKDYSSFLCPAQAVACPYLESGSTVDIDLEKSLNSLADWFSVGFECVELDTELNQCGGCLALGQGQDCATIPNSKTTGCEKSTCTVYSCFDGYTISPDKKSCIRKGPSGPPLRADGQRTWEAL